MPWTADEAAAAREKRGKTAPKSTTDPRYDPLGYCPPENRSRYAKREISAKQGSSAIAVELMCISCMNWQPHLVAGCTDPKCPLWLRAIRGRKAE